MTTERFFLVVLVVLLLGWSAAQVARWWAARRAQTPADTPKPMTSAVRVQEQEAHPALSSELAAPDDVLTVAVRTVLLAPPPNPLAILTDLRLEDALDGTRYGAAAAAFGGRERRVEIDIAGNAVPVVMSVRELASSGRHLTFELTSSIQGGIARGTLQLVRDENGKLLAMVRDTRTGKVTDLLRGVPSGARLGALTATVYGLAHLVSAKDLATKLDALSDKVDLLLAFRSIDQRARLEAAYARVKELGVQPLDAAGRAELRSVRSELRELRHAWRGEVTHTLRALRDPPVVKHTRWHFPGTKAKHVAIRTAIRDAVGLVALMEFSLRLEHLLAVAGEDVEPFLRVLPDELVAWEELTDLLQAKALTIGFDDLSAEPYVEAVRDVVSVYRARTQSAALAEFANEP